MQTHDASLFVPLLYLFLVLFFCLVCVHKREREKRIRVEEGERDGQKGGEKKIVQRSVQQTKQKRKRRLLVSESD